MLSSEIPKPSLFAPVQRENVEPEPIFGCDCCCLQLCPKGSASLAAVVSKTYFVPGEAVQVMMMMVYYCLSKRTPLLNTHTFTPVESELNTLSAALAAPKLRLAGTDP